MTSNIKMKLSNPFAQEEVDHSHVVIPIGASKNRVSTDSEGKVDPEFRSKDNGSASSVSAGGFSIEALRAEVMSDVAAEGHDTAYDRTF